MPSRLASFAIAAALAAGVPGTALAEYPCPPGYALYGGACRAVAAPGYSNPVAGAANGEAAGAANGYATGGPVGAIVGGAVGAATGTVTGTANMLTGGSPACAPGYMYYNGACYPR